MSEIRLIDIHSRITCEGIDSVIRDLLVRIAQLEQLCTETTVVVPEEPVVVPEEPA